MRVSEKLAASANYTDNRVRLREGSFSAELTRVRVDYSSSTHMFLNALVQYNGATRAWLSNIRYRFIYRPLSDIYVVYNETRTPDRSVQRAFIVKCTVLLAF